MKVQTLEITGMTCGHCAQAVTRALQAVPGVATAQVDLALGSARITGDADTAVLIRAVEAEGYGAKPA